MSKIITDISKINLLKSAIVVFFPNGKVIAVEKIPDFDYHIAYLRVLYKGDREIKNILSDVDFKYYMENPSEVVFNLIPLFAKNNCSIFINLSPHIMNPTDIGMIFFNEEPSKQMKSTIKKMKEKFSPILFYNIAYYNPETDYYDSYIENIPTEPNSEMIYEFLNTKSQQSKK